MNVKGHKRTIPELKNAVKEASKSEHGLHEMVLEARTAARATATAAAAAAAGTGTGDGGSGDGGGGSGGSGGKKKKKQPAKPKVKIGGVANDAELRYADEHCCTPVYPASMCSLTLGHGRTFFALLSVMVVLFLW